MCVIYSKHNRFQLKVGTFAQKKSSSTLDSLNLCLDDSIGLSGMIVYLLLVFSGVTCIFLSKLSLGI